MKEELDKKLCEDFPKFFSQRSLDETKTCMCWGFPGDGWEPIIRKVAKIAETYNESIKDEVEKELSLKERTINSIIDFCNKAYHFIKFSIIRKCYIFFKSFTGDGTYNAIFLYTWGLPSWLTKLYTHKLTYVQAEQVKEKFGGLRIYTNYSTDEINEAIETAEKESVNTCENCGKKAKSKRNERGWISTLCTTCTKKFKKEAEERLKKYERSKKN